MSKKKLNVIDYVIIILIIAAIGVAAYLLKSTLNQHSQGNDASTVTFEVFLQEQNTYMGEAVQAAIGEELLLSQKEKDYGTLKDVKVEPAKRAVQDKVSGTFREEALPNKYDITLVIEAKATVSDMGISIGQAPVRTGTQMVVGNKAFAAAGYIFNITAN
jgi:hypothetical protein